MSADQVSTKNTTIFSIFTNLFNNASKNQEKPFLLLLNNLLYEEGKVNTSSSSLYAVKRLVRGFGSERNDVKATCYACATSLLDLGIIKFNDIKLTIENEEKHRSFESGTISTIVFFSCAAIMNSTVFENLSQEDQLFAMDKFMDSSCTKSYLRNTSCHLLSILLNRVSKGTFENVLWPSIKKQCQKNQVDFLPLLALICGKYPKKTKKFVTNLYGNITTFFTQALEQVEHADYLDDDDRIKQIWMSFCEVNTRETPLNLLKAQLSKESKHSARRDLIHLLFIEVIIGDNSPFILSQLFDKKFVDLLYRSMKSTIVKFEKNSFEEKRLLTGRRVLNTIVEQLKSDDAKEIRNIIVDKLLFDAGDVHFDLKTGSNAVQILLQHLDASSISALAEKFKNIILGDVRKSDQTEWSDKEKQAVLPLYVKLLTLPCVEKDCNWRWEQCKFLFELAFIKGYSISNKGNITNIVKDYFFKAIELHSWKIEDAVGLLEKMVIFADSLKLPELACAPWKSMMKITGKLRGENKKVFIALRLLLLHMGLMLLKDAKLGSSAIQELTECYERLSEKKKENDNEPHWVEVTVDLFLSMLSQENKLLRHLIACVFRCIASQITPSGIQQIIDALDPSNKDNFTHVDSELSSDDDNEEENGEEEESESEKSDDDEDDEEKETVNEKLRMAVQNALGYSAAAASDDESVDMDDMDEEEERRLNESLGAAFKMFRPNKGSNKKKQSKEDESVTHFRIRVLDLVEIILSLNPQMETCLDFIECLMNLLEFTIRDIHQKPLQNRVVRMLKKLSAIKKFGEDVSSVSYENIVEVFRKLVDRETPPLILVEMFSSISDCCTFLVRCSMAVSADGNCNKKSLIKIYIPLLERYFVRGDKKISISLFQNVLRILWHGNWKIASKLFSLVANGDIRLFNKLKIIDLLILFYQNDRLHSSATDDEKTQISRDEKIFLEKLPEILHCFKTKVNLLSTFCEKLLKLRVFINSSRNKYRKDEEKLEWEDVVLLLLQYRNFVSQKKIKSKLIQLAREYKLDLESIQPLEVDSRKQVALDNEDSLKKDDDDGDDDDDDELTGEKRKRKGKRLAVGKKMRKESKKLRASFSNGLEDVHFNKNVFEQLNDVEDNANDNVTKKKKKFAKNPKKLKNNT